MAQSMTVMDFLFFKSRQTAQQEGSRARPLRPAMHCHQPAVWGELRVARYGQHCKGSDLEVRVSGADGKDGVPSDLVPDQCRPSLRLALLIYRSLGCKD